MSTSSNEMDASKINSELDHCTSVMESVKLNDRSCKFLVTDTKNKGAAKTPLKKVKNRHPTDPLLGSNSTVTEKKLTLSTSDSYLANRNSSSSSYEKICKKKTNSVSGSSVNIPVAFPSIQGSGSVEDSPKATGSKGSPDNDLSRSSSSGAGGGGKSSRGQRTPKKEAAKGFETYMMLDQVQQGLKRGELIEGVLRINPKNYQDAYISVPGGRMDICLSGIVDRNRALNGDVVVVQLKPKEEWRILFSDLRNYLLRNNLVAVNYLMPKISSSSRKLKSPLKAFSSNTNVAVEQRQTNLIKIEEEEQSTSVELKKLKTRTRRGKKNKKDAIKCEEQEQPTCVELKNLNKPKAPIRRGKKNKKAVIKCEVKENETSVSEVDLIDVPKSVEKVLPNNRRSKRKQICATTDAIAHNVTQVPSSSDITEISSSDCDPQLKVEISNQKELKDSEVHSSTNSSSSSNDLIVDKDLIDFSENSSISIQSSDNFTISNCDFSVISNQPINRSELPEGELFLDDIYYPETLEADKEITNSCAQEDNFDWADLLSQKPLEKLTVEDILKIPSARSFLQPTAKVVYIVRQSHNQMARGHLTLPSDGNRQWALFRPIDHRFPFLRIPTASCPTDFFKFPEKYSKILMLAKMTEWIKPTYAVGIICSMVGSVDDVKSEALALLLENGIDLDEFPSNILNDLPIKIPFHISQEDLSVRRDYRSSCVFTIDPSSARDLDDAVSCDRADLAEGLIRVSVHIADVSYFVTPSTRMDAIASRRSTSVYLVSQVIPMLPPILSEELCSLRPSEDRLTFSVEWIIRESDGAILSEWFGRSVIRSCAQLSYEHAQAMINDEPLSAWPTVSTPWSIEDVKERVKILHLLAVKLRRKRTSRGALRLDQSKICFRLDADGLPEDLLTYKIQDSNRLIEELMILANIAVARRIYKAYPQLAVLRMHPSPVERALDEVVEMLKSYGLHLDQSSSFTLQASLNKCAGVEEFDFARHQLITYLLTKPMKLASYFCSGAMSNENQFHHYALSVPLYTHFTSPIRRYPDILVHRLLASALNNVNLPVEPAQICLLQQQLAHCNHAKMSAKVVSDKCNEAYLTAYVRKLGSIEEDGIVCGIMDQSFDVLIYKLSVVKRVYCEQMNTLKSAELEDEAGGSKQLKLLFSDGIVHIITLFTLVKVMLMVSEDDNTKLVKSLDCRNFYLCSKKKWRRMKDVGCASIVMWFTVIKALAARSLFAIHAFVAVWRVVDIRGGDPQFWYLALTIGLLLIEGFISICFRSGREMKWFCPSVFFYLCCIIPPTWIMELDLVNFRRQYGGSPPSSNNLTQTNRREKLSQIPGLQISIDLELPAEMWAKLLEQFLLVNLVLGRWLLPKGGLTRGQLSQLLLVYIGMAADIVELFEAFKEDVVNTNLSLTCAVLALWSWSLMQFTLVLTATKARKPRLGLDNLSGKESKTDDDDDDDSGCCHPVRRFCAMDTWAIMTTIIFQDGPFLCLRLLLIIRYNVIYRMSVLSFESRKVKKRKTNSSRQLPDDPEIESAIPEVNRNVYSQAEVEVERAPEQQASPQWSRYSPDTDETCYETIKEEKYRERKNKFPIKKRKTNTDTPSFNDLFEEDGRDSVFVSYSQNKGAPWSDISFTLSSPLQKIREHRPAILPTNDSDSENEQKKARLKRSLQKLSVRNKNCDANEELPLLAT